MNNQRPDAKISALLEERIAAGDFPSAVYLAAERGEVKISGALGWAVREPQTHTATFDTVYDLASLTKPLVTGLLSARLLEWCELDLERALVSYLSEFDTEEKRAITVRHLLTHTSGLPAWRPLYITTGGDHSRTLEAIASEPLEYQPGSRVIYSDLGFITLGLLIEKIMGQPIADVARREIFEPLGLEHTLFNPDAALQTGIAACETGNSYERGMCGEMKTAADYRNWREHLIWGEVHDGNAHFLGGAAGHAGLFSTASETFHLAEQFMATTTELLKPGTCALFRLNLTPGLSEARSLAWQLAATKDSTAGPALAPDSFGHTGFTGTSCWIDAARERVFILLTNRTHTRALPFVNINSIRRQFHTLAVAALDRREKDEG